MRNLFIIFLAICWITSGRLAAQQDTTLLVKENYFGKPLMRVLEDFQNKYHLALKYDSALVSNYTFDYLYTGTPVPLAFDVIFRKFKDLSYYADSSGVYCIVPIENLPKNRTKVENKMYQGKATRHNLTVTGRIHDITNGEPLPFASILVKGTDIATATNTDGYFTLYNVPSDKEVLLFKYLGYETQQFYLSPEIPVTGLRVELEPAVNMLDEIQVILQREDVLKIPHEISVIQTTAAKIAELPALGEKDIFRTFQLMPGIAGSNESSAGMYVRGGTPDQNLILYDGFTVYHQDHLMGVFSAFNSNAVKDVQLYKGGFDARYGGRLSSVMELVGKTGNDKYFNIGGDVGFLGFNAFMEVPFHEKGSLFVAGRRSFQSFLYNKFTDVYTENQQTGGMGIMRNQEKPESYFYDLNAKITYNPTKKDILSLSFFNGEDDLDNSRESFGTSFLSGSLTDLTQWGNIGSSLKWSRKWNNRLYSNALISFSNYYSLRNRKNNMEESSLGKVVTQFDQNTKEDNDLWDYSLKLDNEYKFNANNRLEFGLNYSYYDIHYKYNKSDSLTIIEMNNRGQLLSSYIQDRWTFNKKRFTFLPGIRLSYYDVTSKVYPEPRSQFYYDATDKLRFKASTGLYYQFTNRIVREDISAGSRDIWLLSDDQIIPISSAVHYVAGATYETKNYLMDLEIYYKKLRNLSEYTLRYAHSFLDNTDYQQFFYTGKGYSRGLDLLLQKKFGVITGWMGYTLSETRYKFPVYGDGYFAANQDVTHEFKTVLTYKIVKDFTFSATWIYATGRPYTRPIGGYTLNTPNGSSLGYLVVDGKNNARYPDYHRLDLLVKYDLSFIKSFKSSLSFSLFNVYDHVNVWYKEFRYDSINALTETNVNLLGCTPNLTFSISLK